MEEENSRLCIYVLQTEVPEDPRAAEMGHPTGKRDKYVCNCPLATFVGQTCLGSRDVNVWDGPKPFTGTLKQRTVFSTDLASRCTLYDAKKPAAPVSAGVSADGE